MKSALSGDIDSIKKLSLLEFNDAVRYVHGAVIVDLILQIGEQKYLGSILSTNQEQKYLIKTYLDIGLSYGNNPKVMGTELQDIFPSIYAFLKK
ncbi:hypothetical protein [Emticicia sp. 21SJ11W-3]|uniref:hypothetical protein n=1 Tax=Emticicia sp. 21SJ11W-3 TaxID=2916755 RepID=UPI0020A2088D|nr:hypothetical protein [Emticicia sp. 21SJ11W-3]UTA66526.1 hypothetical protein MB380_13045 [Emticicia sp. 21SJ11W-3]